MSVESLVFMTMHVPYMCTNASGFVEFASYKVVLLPIIYHEAYTTTTTTTTTGTYVLLLLLLLLLLLGA